jgi:hypothetical protein
VPCSGNECWIKDLADPRCVSWAFNLSPICSYERRLTFVLAVVLFLWTQI